MSDSPSNSPTGKPTDQGPLFDKLAARIRLEGAITVADYMAEVLTNPNHGYYMGGDPFGQTGDFITAPEISQMFGELIGLWCADTWHNMGRPEPVHIVELGPGRGTLMADLLRAAKILPEFHQALQVHLVEVSPALRAQQKKALAGYEVTWHDSIASLPEAPCLIVANEFFDALPIRQFERTPKGWCERLVTLNEAGDALTFKLSPPDRAITALLPESLHDAPEGAVIERSPALASLAAELGRHIAQHGGAALIVDYGWDKPTAKPSFQAVRQHQKHPVLDAPGTADLTAFVDFPTLAQAATSQGAAAHGPVNQGNFLTAVGIAQRAAMLRQGATDKQAVEITAAEHRLTDPTQMGTLFKVMALTHPDQPVPAAFPEAPSGEQTRQ